MHNSIADFLLDIIQNSIEAESDAVEVVIEDTEKFFSCTIKDNGRGMSESELNRIRDPFYTDGKKHVKRKVGLGIPFLEQMTEMTGGILDIRSKPGEGTEIFFSFKSDHIDTPPVGNIPSAVLAAMTYPADFELLVSYAVSRKGASDGYELRRSELVDILGDLRNGRSQALLRKYIMSQDESLECIRVTR
jgi:hypothetical protein